MVTVCIRVFWYLLASGVDFRLHRVTIHNRQLRFPNDHWSLVQTLLDSERSIP